MLEVYAIPPSLYSAKLRIVLRHKGLAWRELAPPGGYGSAEYKEVVPSGNLPALRDGDLLIADSEAAAEYLEETHPARSLLPGDPAARAKARERGRFHDTRLEPELRRIFPHLPGRPPAPDGFLTAQAAALTTRLGQLGRMLEVCPGAGAPLTLGDVGYPITFAWLDAGAPRMGFSVTWPEPVVAYRRRLADQPAVAAELASYVPALTAFLDG